MLKSLIDRLLGDRRIPADEEIDRFPAPHKPSPPPKRAFPNGYIPDPEREDVFDPALRHYANGFVKGEPHFADGAEATAFFEARSRLLRACVAAIGASALGPELVLRGGATLELWYGERARHAKDIDLVVRDRAVRANGRDGESLLFTLRDLVARTVGGGIKAEDVPIDAIWTYDRAEGRRITCPWTWHERVKDTLQLDIVFDEALCTTPIEGEVEGVSVWLASREESLAWKVLWCVTDRFPQAKDVYDVMLLSEDVRVDVEFIERVFRAKDEPWDADYPACMIDALRDVEDWPAFVEAHPYLSIPSYDVVRERIAAALSR